MGGRPATILVVENYEHARVLLREYLEREGFAVTVARSTHESLEAVRGGAVTAVVVSAEFLTPEGGWGVAAQMREIAASLPIVLLAQREVDAYKVPESISAPHAVVASADGLAYLGGAIRALLAWDGA